MHKFLKYVIVAASLAFSTNAFTADCYDTVVDGAGVISDKVRVQNSMALLGNAGTMPRIRTVKSLNGESLDSYAKNRLGKDCPSWLTPNGERFAGNLLLIMYTPDRKQYGVYYGASVQPFFTGKWQALVRTYLVPSEANFSNGEKDAFTNGFVRLADAFRGLVVTPAQASSGNVTVTSPTDFSGLWSFLKWSLLVGIIIVVGMFGYNVWRNQQKRLSAQNEAKRIRSLVVSKILELSSDVNKALLESAVKVADKDVRPYLQDCLEEYNLNLQAANTQLNLFDSVTGTDPNNARLSVEDYWRNQVTYKKIMENYLEPSVKLADTIKKGVAPKKKKVKENTTYSRANTTPGYSQPQAKPETKAAVQEEPVVTRTTTRRYEDDYYDRPTVTPVIVTPIVVDTPTYRREEPRYEAPSRSSRRKDDDDGGSFSSSSSSSYDSGSSFSSSSSSDSGSSYDSGSSSDSGGSFSSSD